MNLENNLKRLTPFACATLIFGGALLSVQSGASGVTDPDPCGTSPVAINGAAGDSSFAAGCSAKSNGERNVVVGEDAAANRPINEKVVEYEITDIGTTTLPGKLAGLKVNDKVYGRTEVKNGIKVINYHRKSDLSDTPFTLIDVNEFLSHPLPGQTRKFAFEGTGQIIPREDPVSEAVAIGAKAKVTQNGGVAIGAGAEVNGENSIAIGAGAKAGKGATALGAGAKVTGDNGIAIGAGAEAGENEIVIGNERQKKVTIGGFNLADITDDITTNTGNITTNTGNIATNTGNITTNAGNITTNAGNIATNAGNIATNAGNIATNTSNINVNRSGIAMAMAMSNLPTVKGDNGGWGIAGGSFDGESALAVGANFNVGNQGVAKISISSSSGETSFGLGYGMGF